MINKEVRKAGLAVREVGGMVRCGWDDRYFVGPNQKVFSVCTPRAQQ